MSADRRTATEPATAAPSQIKTWQERMPAPWIEMRCTMNCSRSKPSESCGDCVPVTCDGDEIEARDAEIADLRAALARAESRSEA